MFSPEINKVNADVSKELGINVLEVEKVITSYHKNIAGKIKEDRPCEIRIPFFGILFPHKSWITKLKELLNETNNS